MREILFRGKRIDKNVWVFGNLLQLVDTVKIKDINIMWGYIVDKNTVGQYTGLKDMNGNKVFEGDIVRYNGTLHKVVFCNINGCAFFGITMPERGEIWNFDGITPSEKMEVIGNIYDNPELIGGAE